MEDGTLEVHLIRGKDLHNTDLLGKADPYAVISCRNQDQKSTTVNGGGSNPAWNQSFFFTVDKVDEKVSEVGIKLFDEDRYSADDVIGKASIPLAKVLAELEVPAVWYDILRPSGQVQGQVEVALTFTPKPADDELPAQTHHKLPLLHHNIVFNKQQEQLHHHKMSNGPYGDTTEGGWK